MDKYSEKTVRAVAAAFAIEVHGYCQMLDSGSDRYKRMLSENQRDAGTGVCHTHDFCDANVFMAAVIEAQTGKNPAAESLLNDEAMMALWNDAWALAKLHFLPNIAAAYAETKVAAPATKTALHDGLANNGDHDGARAQDSVSDPIIGVPYTLLGHLGEVVLDVASTSGADAEFTMVSNSKLRQMSQAWDEVVKCMDPASEKPMRERGG